MRRTLGLLLVLAAAAASASPAAAMPAHEPFTLRPLVQQLTPLVPIAPIPRGGRDYPPLPAPGPCIRMGPEQRCIRTCSQFIAAPEDTCDRFPKAVGKRRFLAP